MTATPATTISKQEAKYRVATDPARSCGTCSMFLPEERACTLVRGKIKAGDTCDYWEAPAVEKFRDDQLRDDHGRWAFEGGGGPRQAVEVTDRTTGLSGVGATQADAERSLLDRQRQHIVKPPVDVDTAPPEVAAQLRAQHPGHAVTPAIRRRTTDMIARVAQRDGFDPSLVTIYDRAPVTLVGNMAGMTQGAYDPATGKIALFLDHSTVAQNEGALTHEAQHARYDLVEAATRRELRAAEAAGDLHPPSAADDFGALKAGKEGAYPTYAAMYPYLGSHNSHVAVMQDDGISNYSKDYWRMIMMGEPVSGTLATDETLAEVARVRAYGKPAEKKALATRDFLNRYYDAVQQQHARLKSTTA